MVVFPMIPLISNVLSVLRGRVYLSLPSTSILTSDPAGIMPFTKAKLEKERNIHIDSNTLSARVIFGRIISSSEPKIFRCANSYCRPLPQEYRRLLVCRRCRHPLDQDL